MLCAQALRRALLDGRLGGDYERECAFVKKQVSFGLRFRRVFLGLGQDDIERVFEILGSQEAREIIESQADFDDHLKTAKAILRRPRLLARLIRVSPTIIRTLL